MTSYARLALSDSSWSTLAIIAAISSLLSTELAYDSSTSSSGSTIGILNGLNVGFFGNETGLGFFQKDVYARPCLEES